MEFRITVDIFSGRKNPVIEVKGKEATRLYERLRPLALSPLKSVYRSPNQLWATAA